MATVRKFNGTNWVSAGPAGGFSLGEASLIKLSINEDTPYVAYSDGAMSTKVTVMKYE